MKDLTQKIEHLSEQISRCKEFNEKWALASGASQEEVDSGAAILSQSQLDIDRVGVASKLQSAIGVFGQSQCGKSYLISELIGGTTKHLVIPGIEEPRFQDYNRQNVDAESTGVVTRLTFNDSREDAPGATVRVRFLTPFDVMWSFVYGFYNEMDFSAFELTEEQENENKDKINNIKDNEGPIGKDSLESELSECFTFVNNGYVEPPLSALCINHLRQKSSSSISIESFVLFASSLWYFDKNISEAFEARIRTLEYLDFVTEGYLPEELLKDTIDASKLSSLKLSFSNNDMFSSDNGLVIKSANPNNEEVRIQNLQAIVKEVELTVEEDDQSILNQIDVLDFPGARALSGQYNSPTAFQLAGEINDGSSIIIKHMFKRGKLLYLFELYRKQFDITLLLFCSEQANQEAPVLRTMLNSWIDMAEMEENAENHGLFVAFTKSDKLLYSDDHTLKNTDDVDARVTARFNANFSEYYGSWVNNFLNTNQPFNNFYFVRNPEADNSAFQFEGEKEEWINDRYKLSAETFREVFMENSSAEKFLGDNKEVLYDSVFYPGENGIQYLNNSINDKLTNDPERKYKFLKSKLNEIQAGILEYGGQYYLPGGESAKEEKERKDALAFINKLDQNTAYLPELLNGFYRTCPGAKALWQYIDDVQKESQNKLAIEIPPVYNKVIPLFVTEWLHLCKAQTGFSDSIGVEETDLNKFLDKMKIYFLQSDIINPLVEDFDEYFETADYSSARIIRNYLSWIFGEKLYYLEYQEENGTPDAPIKVPQAIDFNSYIINIWKKQLPEIYVKNFKMKQQTEGIELLKGLGEE